MALGGLLFATVVRGAQPVGADVVWAAVKPTVQAALADPSWRIEMVKELDPERTAYLHVVPNTMSVFSAVTCVDS